MGQVLPLHLPTVPRGVILLDPDGLEVGTVDNPIFVEPSGTGVLPVEIVGEVGFADFDTNQVSVGTGATLIVGANLTRGGVLITNPDDADIVYVGKSGVTTSTGQQILPGTSLTLPVTAAVYGVVTAGTITVSYVEVEP